MPLVDLSMTQRLDMISNSLKAFCVFLHFVFQRYLSSNTMSVQRCRKIPAYNFFSKYIAPHSQNFSLPDGYFVLLLCGISLGESVLKYQTWYFSCSLSRSSCPVDVTWANLSLKLKLKFSLFIFSLTYKQRWWYLGRHILSPIFLPLTCPFKF